MDISVIIGTYRIGGIDLVIDSLARQKTDRLWQLVLADEIHEREQAVRDYASEKDIILNYVKAPKHDYISNASTYNAAIKEARGELVVIGGDYSVYPENYLARNWEIYKKYPDTILCTSYLDHVAPKHDDNPRTSKIALDSLNIFKTPFSATSGNITRYEDRGQFVHHWIEEGLGYIGDIQYALGLIGAPREAILRCNGFNEVFNGGRGYSDHYLNFCLSNLGYRFLLDTNLVIHRVARPHQDLKFPFLAKKELRTNAENRQRLEYCIACVDQGTATIDSHKGLEDHEWNRGKYVVLAGLGSEYCIVKMSQVLNSHGIRTIVFRGYNPLFDPSHYIVYGVAAGDLEAVKGEMDKIQVWLWWTGTDVWFWMKEGAVPPIFLDKRIKHLCVSERLQEELETIGIKSEVILDINDTYGKEGAWNPSRWLWSDRTGSILIYMPSDRLDFYNYPLMLEVAKELPDLKFWFYGNKDPLPGLPENCAEYGWVDDDTKERLYWGTRIYLRITPHDGFPYNIVEMKKMGRHVITNYPYPHCHVAETKDEIVEKIKELQNLGQEQKGAEYYQEHFSIEGFVEKFKRIVLGVE